MRQVSDPISQINEAIKQVDELKLKQFTGNSSVQVKVNQSSNQWDIDKTYNLDPQGQNPVIKFSFLADNQVGPFAAFKPYVLLNGVEWNLTSLFMFEINFGTPQYFTFTDEEYTRARFTQYVIEPTIVQTVRFQIKMKVLATDTGVIGAFTS